MAEHYLKFDNKNQFHKTNDFSKLYPKFNFICKDPSFIEKNREYYYNDKKFNFITEYIPVYPENFFCYWEQVSFVSKNDTFAIIDSGAINNYSCSPNGHIEAFSKYSIENMLNNKFTIIKLCIENDNYDGNLKKIYDYDYDDNYFITYKTPKLYDKIVISNIGNSFDILTKALELLKINGSCLLELNYLDSSQPLDIFKDKFNIGNIYIPECQHFLQPIVYITLTNYKNGSFELNNIKETLKSKYLLNQIKIFQFIEKRSIIKYEVAIAWCKKYNLRHVQIKNIKDLRQEYMQTAYTSSNNLKNFICYENTVLSRPNFMTIANYLHPYRYLDKYMSLKYSVSISNDYLELQEVIPKAIYKNSYIINDNGFISYVQKHYGTPYANYVGTHKFSANYYNCKKVNNTKEITKAYIKNIMSYKYNFDLIIINITNDLKNLKRYFILLFGLLQHCSLGTNVIMKIVLPIDTISDRLFCKCKKLFKSVNIVLPKCRNVIKMEVYIVMENMHTIPKKYFKVLNNNDYIKCGSNLEVIEPSFCNMMEIICYNDDYENDLELQKIVENIQKVNRELY